jgi:hypothetical protein
MAACEAKTRAGTGDFAMTKNRFFWAQADIDHLWWLIWGSISSPALLLIGHQ